MDLNYYREQVPPYWKSVVNVVYYRHKENSYLDLIMRNLIADVHQYLNMMKGASDLGESVFNSIRDELLEKYDMTSFIQGENIDNHSTPSLDEQLAEAPSLVICFYNSMLDKSQQVRDYYLRRILNFISYLCLYGIVEEKVEHYEQVDPTLIFDYLSQYVNPEQSISINTLFSYKTIISYFFEFLVQQNVISSNPCEMVVVKEDDECKIKISYVQKYLECIDFSQKIKREQYLEAKKYQEMANLLWIANKELEDANEIIQKKDKKIAQLEASLNSNDFVSKLQKRVEHLEYENTKLTAAYLKMKRHQSK